MLSRWMCLHAYRGIYLCSWSQWQALWMRLPIWYDENLLWWENLFVHHYLSTSKRGLLHSRHSSEVCMVRVHSYLSWACCWAPSLLIPCLHESYTSQPLCVDFIFGKVWPSLGGRNAVSAIEACHGGLFGTALHVSNINCRTLLYVSSSYLAYHASCASLQEGRFNIRANSSCSLTTCCALRVCYELENVDNVSGHPFGRRCCSVLSGRSATLWGHRLVKQQIMLGSLQNKLAFGQGTGT